MTPSGIEPATFRFVARCPKRLGGITFLHCIKTPKRTQVSTVSVRINKYVKCKVKCSPYRTGLAQRVGRGIALLFHDLGARSGLVVSSTSRPHFTPGKDPVPTFQEAAWAPGPVRTGGKSRPHRDSSPGPSSP